MGQPTFFAIACVFVIGSLVLAFLWQKKQVARLREEFANDPEVEVEDGWTIRMNTRPPLRPGHVTQAGGGKNNPARWDVVCEAKDFSARTTLSLSREGAFGSLREMLGVKDVHVGEEGFDKKYTVRGTDPDAVRGIVSQQAVMAAVDELFALEVWSVEVKKNGAVAVRAPRSRTSGTHAKALLVSTVLLAALLDDNANQPAVPTRVA